MSVYRLKERIVLGKDEVPKGTELGFIPGSRWTPEQRRIVGSTEDGYVWVLRDDVGPWPRGHWFVLPRSKVEKL